MRSGGVAFDQKLHHLIVCPQCKGALAAVEAGRALLCERCQLKYSVRNGIPIMLVEEADDLRRGGRAHEGGEVKLPKVSFRVIDGPDVNMTFHLDEGSCRALGRGSVDVNKTTVFHVDLALALDEGTRSLILQYVGKQFRKAPEGLQAASDRIGAFRRAPDIVLTDSGLSHLHAMIFSDESGVGILDLVSKNGTFVNGQEIESKLLKRGDRIELGETTIVFEG